MHDGQPDLGHYLDHASTSPLRPEARAAMIDVLGAPLGPPGAYCDLDEFYRRGLAQGLDLHQRQERGFLPGDLVQEIRALSHPPLPSVSSNSMP